MDADISQLLEMQIRDAMAEQKALCISGGNSKHFLGGEPRGEQLSVAPHRGITSYEPGELVLTARAGTPLTEIRAALDEQGQCLAFEPPGFGDQATLGGTIAAAQSGPQRPFAGSARDFVLGVHCINGKGEQLGFGGQVMKNVAGYDVSRLMTGAMGTLGVLLDISLKVLPAPRKTLSFGRACDLGEALELLANWRCKPLPLSAACHVDNTLFWRLSGSPAAVDAAAEALAGDAISGADSFWQSIAEHRHDFFQQSGSLWRLSVPASSGLETDSNSLIDWAGAQRWVLDNRPAAEMQSLAEQAGGHATLFNSDQQRSCFHPLPDGLMHFHRQLKQAFDPQGLFNPGRLYPEF